jgi:hypothetical protein
MSFTFSLILNSCIRLTHIFLVYLAVYLVSHHFRLFVDLRFKCVGHLFLFKEVLGQFGATFLGDFAVEN